MDTATASIWTRAATATTPAAQRDIAAQLLATAELQPVIQRHARKAGIDARDLSGPAWEIVTRCLARFDPDRGSLLPYVQTSVRQSLPSEAHFLLAGRLRCGVDDAANYARRVPSIVSVPVYDSLVRVDTRMGIHDPDDPTADAVVNTAAAGVALTAIRDVFDRVFGGPESIPAELQGSARDPYRHARGVTVRALVAESVAATARRVAQRPVSVAASVADDVPDVITGDRSRVRQLLDAVVAGALHSTTAGPIHLALAMTDPDTLQITATTPTPWTDDTQWAELATCRETIRVSGGTFGVGLGPGGGTVAWISLPVGTPPAFLGILGCVPETDWFLADIADGTGRNTQKSPWGAAGGSHVLALLACPARSARKRKLIAELRKVIAGHGIADVAAALGVADIGAQREVLA